MEPQGQNIASGDTYHYYAPNSGSTHHHYYSRHGHKAPPRRHTRGPTPSPSSTSPSPSPPASLVDLPTPPGSPTPGFSFPHRERTEGDEHAEGVDGTGITRGGTDVSSARRVDVRAFGVRVRVEEREPSLRAWTGARDSGRAGAGTGRVDASRVDTRHGPGPAGGGGVETLPAWFLNRNRSVSTDPRRHGGSGRRRSITGNGGVGNERPGRAARTHVDMLRDYGVRMGGAQHRANGRHDGGADRGEEGGRDDVGWSEEAWTDDEWSDNETTYSYSYAYAHDTHSPHDPPVATPAAYHNRLRHPHLHPNTHLTAPHASAYFGRPPAHIPHHFTHLTPHRTGHRAGHWQRSEARRTADLHNRLSRAQKHAARREGEYIRIRNGEIASVQRKETRGNGLGAWMAHGIGGMRKARGARGRGVDDVEWVDKMRDGGRERRIRFL